MASLVDVRRCGQLGGMALGGRIRAVSAVESCRTRTSLVVDGSGS
ncbi:hypothetical protein [Streptomyces sp. NPDC057253]